MCKGFDWIEVYLVVDPQITGSYGNVTSKTILIHLFTNKLTKSSATATLQSWHITRLLLPGYLGACI